MAQEANAKKEISQHFSMRVASLLCALLCMQQNTKNRRQQPTECGIIQALITLVMFALAQEANEKIQHFNTIFPMRVAPLLCV